MKHSFYKFSLFFFMIAFSTHSISQAYSKSGELPKLPPSKAKVRTLENGLTVIVEEERSAPVASVQVWVGTGSIHEGKWLGAGLSHILEHMLFKGTKTRKAGDIARAVQDQGGYINAYTSFDRTVYWIDVPASGAGEAVDILADAMLNSTLPEDEYIKEQEVIRREFAMGKDDPDRNAIQLLLRTMYPASPRGLPIIGYLELYNRLTRDDVMEYYKRRYVPNNMTLIVAGDVIAEEIFARAEKAFGGAERGVLEPVFVPREEPQLGRREAHEEFPTELTRMHLAWRVPGLDNPDAPAIELLAMILGTGRSSILNRELREKRMLAHGIGAGVYNMPEESAFFISAVADAEKRDALEKGILEQIAAIQKDGVPPEALEKARRALLSDLLGGLSTARGRASSAGSDWFLTRNLNFGRQFLEAVGKVDKEDIRRAAQKYLVPDRLTVTSLNPVGSLVKPPESTANSEKGAVQKFTLSNGLTLLVREDPLLPLVSATIAFRGGLLVEKPENNGITNLLARTILKGTKTQTADQISERIESLGGSIDAEAGNNSIMVSIDAMRPDLESGLEILADVVQNPIFPEREIELERNTQIASIKAEEDQITSVARNLLRQRLFGNHPYSMRNLGTAESIGRLTRKDLMEFHKTLVTAGNGVLAVFGDVKAEEVVKLAERFFGNLPAGGTPIDEVPVSEPLKENIVATAERDKKQAVLMIGYRGVAADSPDRIPLEIISAASNDIGSRFFDRIREQMGLAYFVGAHQMIGLAPGMFVFYLGTDPAKLDKVAAAFEEEIAKLANDGLTPEELERAKKKLIGAEAIQNQSNVAYAKTAAVDELSGTGYDYSRRRPELVNAVTLEQVRDVARKYFRDAKSVRITVLPPAAKVTSHGSGK
jgi:zinc protease